jgi:hypothetical protein
MSQDQIPSDVSIPDSPVDERKPVTVYAFTRFLSSRRLLCRWCCVSVDHRGDGPERSLNPCGQK